jgi:putative integral membrane protein (TIGR02587 family)
MSAAAVPRSPSDLAFARDLARGAAGALIFAVPLLMTMEMWALGHAMDRARLALFLASGLPLLFGLSWAVGLRQGGGWLDHALETLTAVALGFLVSAAVLFGVGALRLDLPVDAWLGQVALQSVPAGIGALLARRQLGASRADEPRGYAAELFLMIVGALFLALNMAPTEEMVLIAWRLDAVQSVALLAATLILMHAFVYGVGFAGQEHGRPALAFFHFTLAGYGLVLLTCLYVLWLLGRTDGQGAHEMAALAVTLGFPAGLGAAAARLLV